ncbi:5'-AMP-activated protein kinase beta subunit, interation domain-containing protein [Whalleya microplaca]|nr:5'-AMP-activated protein kinase beta subunit, interation domain-containing protein [Whalleya microplaca]
MVAGSLYFDHGQLSTNLPSTLTSSFSFRSCQLPNRSPFSVWLSHRRTTPKRSHDHFACDDPASAQSSSIQHCSFESLNQFPPFPPQVTPPARPRTTSTTSRSQLPTSPRFPFRLPPSAFPFFPWVPGLCLGSTPRARSKQVQRGIVSPHTPHTMGNNPSTSKPATPTPASTHDSPRASKKEPKNLVSIHHQQIRSPASPEASVVQAQGSTIVNRNSQSRPLSILNSSSPSTTTSNCSTGPPPPKVLESRQRPFDFKDEHSQPVAVPASHSHSEQEPSFAIDSQYEESLRSGPTSSSIQDMSYHTSRPPRLPLPIEEEIHTPGSPIVAPTDADEKSIDDITLDDSNSIPRRASGLSNATDEEDTEELRVDKTRPTIPTRIEWLRGGQKVYVTGTPFQWSRKQRLVPAKGKEGVLETVIPVFPGTHHIKFLVDGSMQTSPDLPTTVDFGNNLVNYIEVSGDDARNLPLDPGVPKSNEAAQRLPSAHPSADDSAKVPQHKIIDPVETFSSKFPKYLDDFDQPEDTPLYKLSTLALERLPAPPSLPGFLSKPILNNTTLIKDDNSVLNMPNHTVLNHLATCSIKNNVLAVSATTRYQNKYVTTIIYKATKDD